MLIVGELELFTQSRIRELNGWLNITDGGPRIVAAPWEQAAKKGSRRIEIGLEAGVLPERGPVDLYRSRWPERFVTWNYSRQLFEIGSYEDLGFREFVFLYDAPPDPDGNPRGPEELCAMIESGDMTITRVFRDFDYAFVKRRLMEAMEFDAMNRDSAKLADQVIGANRSIVTRNNKDVASRQAARMGEIRRYLPRLAGEKKIPLVAGANFTH
jgi:hypothetical protein